jgi:translation initiation factor 2 beta subunit (eIF-2beta)/eIF-5
MDIVLDFNAMADEAYQFLENDLRHETLVLPTIITESGTTRIHWKNVIEYLQVIKRHPDHFMDFLKHEFNHKEINWYSGSKSEGLIIHGKNQKRSNIMDIALKYINIYVICSSCKKTDSTLTKQTSKNYEFECLHCGMKKYV